MVVSADGEGVVSHAGTALLRELATQSGLVAGWTEALLDTYKAPPSKHLPGQVLGDLAVMIAGGGDALTHLGRCAIRTSCSGRWPRRRPPGGCSTASTPNT